MNEREVLLGHQPLRFDLGLVLGSPDDADLGAERLDRLALVAGHELGHAHNGTRPDTRRDACATARPWLPVETVTTPRARATSPDAHMKFVAPRSLNAPVSCAVSSLREIRARPSADRDGEATSGVRRIHGAIRARAR